MKMLRQKQSFACITCNFVTTKWSGSCPQCNEWNTFEPTKGPVRTHYKKSSAPPLAFTPFKTIETHHESRLTTGMIEWDRVLGGGILPGSLSILTGDPGIGKSTLLLTVAHIISQNYDVLYFSSEESLAHTKKRALRLGIDNTNLLLSDQSCLETMIEAIYQKKPDLVIIDSLQNCFFTERTISTPGSINQLKEAGFMLMRLAKEMHIATITTGHITKEGVMAGPKVLEHIVDAVFYLQAIDQWQTRVLRSVKNRFGSINELGFFEMHETGLKQIHDINRYLIDTTSHAPGCTLTCTLEGSRPLLLELQALCVESKYGIPQRVMTGIDPKRVILIAAILEKYLKIKMSSYDIFFKVSGSTKLTEQGSDLAIAVALLSSYFQQPLTHQALVLGEISLAGTIKPIKYADIRITEAERFGVKSYILADRQATKTTASLMRFKNVFELLTLFPE